MDTKYCDRCGYALVDICGQLFCHKCNTFRMGFDGNDPSKKYYGSSIDNKYSSHWYNKFIPEKKLASISVTQFHEHNQTKVEIGPYHIWCSEYPKPGTKRKIPDLGVYLAKAWMDISPVWSTGTRSGIDFGLSMYPSVFVDWDDMDIPDFEVLCKIVDYIVRNIQQNKMVEIGCYGGHGRTGTLLACIMIKILQISGQEAIDKVRKEYCHEAIETKKQEDIIIKYADKKE